MICRNCSAPIHQEGNPPMWYHSRDRYSPCHKGDTVAEPRTDEDIARLTDAMINGPWGTR